jgi:hypothetical protein
MRTYYQPAICLGEYLRKRDNRTERVYAYYDERAWMVDDITGNTHVVHRAWFWTMYDRPVTTQYTDKRTYRRCGKVFNDEISKYGKSRH